MPARKSEWTHKGLFVVCEWLSCLLPNECSGGSLTLIRLLLIQLTLVDQRQHGEAVLEQIFDILAVSSDPARLLIINRLEDIVDITLHNRVMTKLL